MRRDRICTLLLAALLSLPLASWGASKQYVSPETALTFTDAATSGSNFSINFTALANGAGVFSDRVDRGAGAHAALYKWRCTFQGAATMALGGTVEVYLSTSDGTNADGELATTKGTLATDLRNNLQQLGLLQVDQTAANVNMTTSGIVFFPDRYFQIAVWNALGQAFRTSTTVHKCSFTPSPPEQQ